LILIKTLTRVKLAIVCTISALKSWIVGRI
jgi:hypothetical protein